MQLKTLLKKSVRSCRKICIFVQDVEKYVHPSRAKKQLATLFFLGSSQKRQQFHFCEAPLNLRSNTDCIKLQHCSGTLAQQIGIGIIRREHLMSSTYNSQYISSATRSLVHASRRISAPNQQQPKCVSNDHPRIPKTPVW